MIRSAQAFAMIAGVLLASACTSPPGVEHVSQDDGEKVAQDQNAARQQNSTASEAAVSSVTTTTPPSVMQPITAAGSEHRSENAVTNNDAPPSQVIQPINTQPQVIQPLVVQPQVAQPQVAQPQVVQPQVVQPQVVDTPENTEPYAGHLLIPITPFSNMEKGWQATNPGFRAALKDSSGKVIASGPLTMDAVINGSNDDASRGSAYGRLVLKVGLKYLEGSVVAGASNRGSGKLSICMDKGNRHDIVNCERLSSDIDASDRPYQWFDMPVEWSADGQQIKIERYMAATGEGGTSQQIALSVYHPAYGFAAPGKAFKDYQSPLVIDLNGNKALDLIDVWDESKPVTFDITGSGVKSRTGWVKGSDALLVLDVNGNGAIDSGAELFGEYSHKVSGLSEAQAASIKESIKGSFANGFAALAQYDRDYNGKINAKDEIFSKLRLWRDLNQNGQSEMGELMSLKAASISSISLAWKSTDVNGSPLMVAGNEVRMTSTALRANGQSVLVGDVWFMQRRSESQVSMKGGAQ
jgi:hypothetical protein